MLTLKIQRLVLEITEKDRFLDNGTAIMLISDRPELKRYEKGAPYWERPTLSKKAVGELSKFPRIIHSRTRITGAKVFSIVGEVKHDALKQ